MKETDFTIYYDRTMDDSDDNTTYNVWKQEDDDFIDID